MHSYRAIGLMSGTSMDGVDVALLETDGEVITGFGPTGFRPYSEPEQAVLRRALEAARTLERRTDRPAPLQQAEELVTRCHIEAVESLLRDNGIARESIDIIGFHGQTVFHDAAHHLTVQLGDGHALAAAVGRPVVFDLRAVDVEADGEGAPLAPIYHRALAQRIGRLPAVFVNIGGVANVTFVGEDDTLLAFDTGPGNALIDDWMRSHTGEARDEGGAVARSGAALDPHDLQEMLRDPYFDLKPPKSLDRDHFHMERLAGRNLADGARALVQFTVGAITLAAQHFPQKPACWVVCGGGRHNAFLMETLAEALDEPVVAAEAEGLDGDAIEAQAFAYMAVRRLRLLPITFPGTTGVAEPLTGGMLVEP